MLVLKAHFSYITKYKKLVFINTDETRDKLRRNCSGDHLPFTDEEFIVSLRDDKHAVPVDIASLVGLECAVTVKIAPYNFVSRHKSNFGEKISGTRLVLLDIKRI